jgi:signal transduction histidine kinase
MDNSQEGILLIGTTMVLLVVFAITVLAVMVIYRRRKLDHQREIAVINERFTRELMQAQIEVQRETMRYIGREIHDNVGQKLVLAALYAEQVHTGDAATGDAATRDTATGERIRAIAGILHESLDDLRSLSKSLTELNHLNSDLYQLISNECTRVRMTGACPVRLDSNTTQISCALPVKSFTLRILQEFLQNSLKHAGCTEIAVRIDRKEDALEITIADNGSGFDPDEAMNSERGIGLKNMRTRAEMIGATLRLSSATPGGTKMILTIPSNKLNT